MWTREDRFAIVAYIVFAAAAATLTLVKDTTWRYEYAHATDHAGVYLFFAAPFLLGVTALIAQRRAALLRGFSDALSHPHLGPRAAWLPLFAIAALVHLVVIVVALAVARSHQAANIWSEQPFIRQFLLIGALCAAGALIGSLAKSLLVPSLVLLLAVTLAFAVPATGLRAFLLAGTGTFDFAFNQYRASLLILGALVFVGFLLLVLPLRQSHRSAQVTVVGANAVLAAAVVMSWSGQPYYLAKAERPVACAEQQPKVCGPAGLGIQLDNVATAAAQTYAALPPKARAALPTRFTLDAAQDAGRNGIEYETAWALDEQAINGTVLASMSGTLACNPDRAGALETSKAAAIVSGWLQQRLNSVVDGSYPDEEVNRLLALPDGAQRDTVTRLLGQIWQCGEVDLSALR